MPILYRRVKVQETVYELLTQEYELARIQEAKDIPVISVIDAPGVPEKKSFPPRLIVALIFTLLAVIAAGALVLMQKTWHEMNEDDARKVLLRTMQRSLPVRLQSTLLKGGVMRMHLSNSAYGLLGLYGAAGDDAIGSSYPAASFGVAEYGIWLIASAAVGAGSVVSSGFGDAVIQRVATLRASNNLIAIRKVITNLLAINLLLSGALAMLLWGLIPWATRHITHFDPSLQRTCLWSLHIGAVLIVLKSIESVFISAQRAFERYGPAVRIGMATRGLTILVSIVLALRGFRVPALMVGAGVLVAGGAVAQWAALRRHLGAGLFKPSLR